MCTVGFKLKTVSVLKVISASLLFFVFPVVRGFVQRRKFRVLLAAKREQEKRVAEFLSKLPMEGDELYSRQKTMCRTDETRPKGEKSVCLSVCLSMCMYVSNGLSWKYV